MRTDNVPQAPSDGRPVHFISGLPRSGSTLLSAILRQNPKFSASMTSPVAMLWGTLLPKMGAKGEFSTFFDDPKRQRILTGTLDAYYGTLKPGQVIFDTNRTWTARLPLICALYPKARMICCVRNVGWIIDSIEKMLRKNPLQTSRVFDFKADGTIYSRVETLMNSERGLVGLAWASLREAWFSEYASKLIMIDYERLTANPAQTIEGLYGALGEPIFKHDFRNVAYDEPGYDADLGMPGMHKVRERVEHLDRPSCIPPDVMAKYKDTAFWLSPTSRQAGPTLL